MIKVRCLILSLLILLTLSQTLIPQNSSINTNRLKLVPIKYQGTNGAFAASKYWPYLIHRWEQYPKTINLVSKYQNLHTAQKNLNVVLKRTESTLYEVSQQELAETIKLWELKVKEMRVRVFIVGGIALGVGILVGGGIVLAIK